MRPYVPGDDVRRIEWNVTARTGETHVRIDLAERVLVTWLALDVSRLDVVRHRRPAEGRRRGGRRARARPSREPARQPARPRRLRRRAVAGHAAARRAAPGCWGSCSRCGASPCSRAAARPRSATALGLVSRLARQRSLVAIVSDFRGPRDWRPPLLQLAGGHDVLAVEIRDPREETLPNVGELRLVDPETGRQLRVDTASREAARALRGRGGRRARRGRTRAHARSASATSSSRPRATGCGRSRSTCGSAGSRDGELRSGRSMLLALLLVPLARRRLLCCSSDAGSARRRPFANPALVPNLVGRRPGRLRHVPPRWPCSRSRLLATGLARPHAKVSVEREEATVVLAIDTSRSMVATDVPPSRLAAAQQAVAPLPRQPAEGVPRRHGLVRAGRLDGAARDGEPGCREARARRPAHRRRHGARRGNRPRGPGRAARARRGRQAGRPPRSSCSPTAPRRRACSSRCRRRSGRSGSRSRSTRSRFGTRGRASSRCVDDNGFTQRVTVPPDPPTLRQIAAATGGTLLRGSRRRAAERRLRGARLAARARERRSARSPRRSPPAARSCCSPQAPSPRSSSGGCREASAARPAARRRRLGRGLAAAPKPDASATGCSSASPSPARGWQVNGGATPTYYQLSCPGRGQVIGGLDADRAGPLEITFLGNLGGPISPGVTTERAAVFVARTTRALSGFRPLARLHPGGRRRRPRADVVRAEAEADRGGAAGRRRDDPPGQERAAEGPADRARSRTRCLQGERLLAFSTAVAFRTRRPPSLAALGSVRATARRAGRGVVVDVRSRITRPVGTRIEVQIHAICVRGPS